MPPPRILAKSIASQRAPPATTVEGYRPAKSHMKPTKQDALEKWALRMGAQGFPPRLDIFKAMAEH